HVLIGAVFNNLQVGHPLNCPRCAFEDLSPRLASIGAAPDRTLESCHSKVGAAEQNQIGIVVTETRRVKVGFEQRPLVRTEWRPASVVLAAVQAFLSYARWPAGNGVERAVGSEPHIAIPRWWRRLEQPGSATVRRRKHATVIGTLECNGHVVWCE